MGGRERKDRDEGEGETEEQKGRAPFHCSKLKRQEKFGA